MVISCASWSAASSFFAGAISNAAWTTLILLGRANELGGQRLALTLEGESECSDRGARLAEGVRLLAYHFKGACGNLDDGYIALHRCIDAKSIPHRTALPGHWQLAYRCSSFRASEKIAFKATLILGGSAEHEVHVNGVVRKVHATIVGALDQTRIQQNMYIAVDGAHITFDTPGDLPDR